jgi:peptidoglycan/xylan/chitin deacetylase (PgdA/CDA1 family)
VHSLSAMGDLAPAVMWRLRRMIDRGGRLPEIWRLPETVTEIGLSFDDGPTAETTPALIELLRAHQATATFFLTGDRATATPELVKALVDAGHDVFPHGWDHIRYGRLRPDIAVRDLDRAEAMLSRIRPTPSPYLVRLPYGSGHGDPRLHRAIRQWNPASQIVNWDYDTRDWAMADGCGDEAQLKITCDSAADRILGHPGIVGSIVLLHENPYDSSAPLSARVAPLLMSALLSRMSERGLRGSRVVTTGST